MCFNCFHAPSYSSFWATTKMPAVRALAARARSVNRVYPSM
jgi:hypothetical protein